MGAAGATVPLGAPASPPTIGSWGSCGGRTRTHQDELVQKLRDEVETLKRKQAETPSHSYTPVVQTFATPVVTAAAVSEATRSKDIEIAELNQKRAAEKQELSKKCDELAKQSRQRQEQLAAVNTTLLEERRQREALSSALAEERKQKTALVEAKRIAEEQANRRAQDLREFQRRHNDNDLLQQQQSLLQQREAEQEFAQVRMEQLELDLAESKAHAEQATEAQARADHAERQLRDVSLLAAVKSPGDFLKMYRDTMKENVPHEHGNLKLEMARVVSDRDRYMEALRAQRHSAPQ